MIKPPGNRVRCSKCGNTFFVERKEEKLKTGTELENQSETSDSGFTDSWINPESEILSQEKECEKIELQREASSLEESEISGESSQTHEESRSDIEQTPITDGINWEEFVSITKSKSEDESLDIKTVNSIEKREPQSQFNWAKLRVDDEPEESLAEPPKLFAEMSDETNSDSQSSSQFKKINPETEISKEPRPNILTLDDEKLTITKKESQRASHYSSNNLYSGINPQRTSSLVGEAIKKFTYVLITLLVLAIIAGAGMVILANQGLIPQEKVRGISESILSILPVNLTENPGKDIIVSDPTSRWIGTRNGLVYVVSGTITNRSKYVVNYLKLKSDFTSDGKSLFERVVYAGNTFTENELQTLSIDAMFEKLNRRNGDINFDNPKKLAGLNFGIEPGESVPFFSIFPSESRILGLKYNISVAGFETAQ